MHLVTVIIAAAIILFVGVMVLIDLSGCWKQSE